MNDKTCPIGAKGSPVPNWFDPLPCEKKTRANCEAWLQSDLVAQFKSFLNGANLTDLELQDRFDQFLLDNAERMGPRLLCCDAVRVRVIHWHDGHADGKYRSERFYKALQHHFDVTRGLKKGTLQPIDHLGRENMVKEMKILQQCLHGATAGHQRYNWNNVATKIESAPGRYPYLIQNLLSLEQFFGQNPNTLASFAQPDGGLPAAEAVNQFFGWATNRDPESARQVISRLGN